MFLIRVPKISLHDETRKQAITITKISVTVNKYVNMEEKKFKLKRDVILIRKMIVYHTIQHQ